jgi:hypothetical protein
MGGSPDANWDMAEMHFCIGVKLVSPSRLPPLETIRMYLYTVNNFKKQTFGETIPFMKVLLVVLRVLVEVVFY